MGTPSFRDFLKAKRKQEDEQEPVIELFVGKKKKYLQCKPEIQQRKSFTVIVHTAGSHKFIVPRDAACLSGCIKRMLEGNCPFKESSSGIIFLPEIRPVIFERIIKFMIREWMYNSNSERTFGTELDDETVMELLMACHYLELPSLMETTCKMLAHNLERLATLEYFPDEVLQKIFKYADPRVLVGLESNPEDGEEELHISVSEEIWKYHYSSNDWMNDRVDYLKGYLPSLSLCLPPYPNAAAVLPQTFDFLGQTEILWKQEFCQRVVQARLNCFSGDPNDYSSLLDDIKEFTEHVTLLQIPQTFLATTKPQGDVHWFDLDGFLIQFPLLKHLIIERGILTLYHTKQLVAAIPTCCPLVRSLGLSNTKADDFILREICLLLQIHPLVSLDISENWFFHSGLFELAQTLSSTSSLKCLSLHSNQLKLKCREIPYYYRNMLPHWDATRNYNTITRSCEDCPLAGDALLSCLSTNSTLNILDLGYNEICLSSIQRSSWELFKNNCSLSCFMVPGAVTMNDDMYWLDFLPSSLEYLNLAAVLCNQLVAGVLLQGKRLCLLKALDISQIYADYTLIVSHNILEIPQAYPSLQSWNIARNRISGLPAATKIAEDVTCHPTLHYISLANNKLAENSIVIVEAVTKKLAAKQMRMHVDLSGNEIPFTDLKTFKTLAMDHPLLSLYLD